MSVDAELIARRVREARSCIMELKRLTSIPFTELVVDQVYSMRYNIIVLVESLVSLAIHILVEEYGYRPSYYSEAVEQFARRLGLQPSCIEDLRNLIRLRNLLIHRYWVIDDERVYSSVKKDFKCVEELLDKVSKRYGGDKVL